MKYQKILTTIFILMFVSSISVYAGEWRFPVGLSYLSGFSDLVDIIEDNKKGEGYDIVTVDYIPVGVSFHPYVELDHGLSAGAGIGPLMIGLGDVSFLVIPINADLRYFLMPDSSFSPYLRAGLRYDIATGDYIESSGFGFLTGVGVEFFRDKTVGLGVELMYDSTEIELESSKRELIEYSYYGNYYYYYDTVKTTKKVKPGEIIFSVYAVF